MFKGKDLNVCTCLFFKENKPRDESEKGLSASLVIYT